MEYDEKDTCILKLAKSTKRVMAQNTNLIKKILEHLQIRDIEFWTSGTQAECKGKLRWCSLSKRFTRRNVTWAANEDGDCLSIKFTKKASILAKTACEKQLNFICEVKKITFSREFRSKIV